MLSMKLEISFLSRNLEYWEHILDKLDWIRFISKKAAFFKKQNLIISKF